MKKLYSFVFGGTVPPTHSLTVHSREHRRTWLSVLFTVISTLVLVGFTQNGFTQCTCAGTDYGNLNVAGWTVGQSANIATNIYAGERSTIQNTVAGAIYRVSTCGASYDSQLTIYTTSCGASLAYNDDNGPACSGASASVDFTSPGGNIYAKLNQYNCATNSTNTTVSVTLISLPEYKTEWISMNTGSSNWCAGETRSISVTIKNIGVQSWTDGGGNDFNVGVKWNADADYFVRVDAQNLAPGATKTYTFTVTAPTSTGSNNLTFDVVREGCFWFANNGSGCGSNAGPGNVVYTSPAINIKPLPTSVSAGTDVTICAGESVTLSGSATAPSVNTTALFTDFNGGVAPGWTVLDGGATTDTWFILTGGYFGDDLDGTDFAFVDSDNAGSVNMDESLVSPLVDVSSYTSLFLEFDQYFNLYTTEIADVDVWNGSAWINVASFTSDIGGWGSPNQQNINVTAYINSNFQVRFHYYNANYEWYWAVDNVKLSGLLPSTVTYAWSPSGPTVTPTSTTTYTMTATANGCSATDAVTVTVKTLSTAPTSASASNTFSCSASAVDLTAVGGSLGTGATWEWYSDATFTTSVGSGSPLTVYPTVNTTYYVRAEGDCNTTSAQSVAVFINGGSTAPGGSVSLASSTSASTCVVNDNNWHYFYNSSGELLAAINSNNQNLGNVTVEITVGDDGPFGQGFSSGVCGYTGVSDGEYVVPRYWDIAVDNQPNSAVDVIFYYNSADVTTLVNTINTLSADYVTCWGDVNSESDLMMTVNHTGGGTELFASLSPSAGPAAGQRQIAFSLSEFSGGKLHSNGGLTGAGNALPVELISFTAKAVNNQFIQLNWSTATEINNEGFVIERSEDGINFEKIGYIKGNGNSNITNQYSYQDSKVNEGIYYYRLKQNDYDGASEYSIIRNAKIESNQLHTIIIKPNPARDYIIIDLGQSIIISSIRIYNTYGAEEIIYLHNNTESVSVLTIETGALTPGIYTIKIDGFESQRFVIQR